MMLHIERSLLVVKFLQFYILRYRKFITYKYSTEICHHYIDPVTKYYQKTTQYRIMYCVY